RGAGRACRPPARRQGHGQGGGSGALSLGRACQRQCRYQPRRLIPRRQRARSVEASLIGMLRLLEHGDFLGLFSTLMADYAKRFGLVTITHEGTFWDAEAGLAYMRTNRPARMIESFKSMVRAAVSA